MKKLTRFMKAARSEDGRVILATDTPCDQDGLILRNDGWDLSRVRDGRIKASYNHHTNGPRDFPIAIWENVSVSERGLTGKGPKFASEEYPDVAGVAERLWNADPPLLDDVSVTFSYDAEKLGPPIEREGKTYRESYSHTLIEAAVVFIGADQNAGKGRLQEAITRGVIDSDEAAEIESAMRVSASDPTEEITRLQTEVERLIDTLEVLTERIDRLTAEEGDGKTASRAAEPPQDVQPQLPEVSRKQITEMIRAETTAAINAIVERVTRKLRGRLPD